MSLTESLCVAYKKWSLFTKISGTIILSFYLYSFFPRASKMLAIIPGYFMPPNYHVWTLFTFIFFDNHLYCVLIDLLTLFFSNTLLEPLWGQKELLRFLLIVSVTSGLICLFICYFLYLSTQSVKIIFGTHIHGMIAYAAAVTVAVRQTLPDDIIVALPVANIKNQHLSFICLIIVLLMAAFHLVEFIYPCLFASGIMVSWIYLRFFQKHDNGNYGDLSDSFEFARFFPNHLVPPVSIASNALMSVLVRLRLCSRRQKQQQQQQQRSRHQGQQQQQQQLSVVVELDKKKPSTARAHAAGPAALTPPTMETREPTPDSKESVTEAKESVTEVKESVTEVKESVTEAKESVTEVKESVTEVKESMTESKESTKEAEGPKQQASPAHKRLSSLELRQLPVPDLRPQLQAGAGSN